ncbi:heterokaryon incompatibility protein-domain-containing protein [Colletotrichum phormii]|uniref:Heterokaryon incompatibility protein-domain-containing protein n=1 Tax=Colletotrichum phormii TaxID=359342 RepID=A0AAJ0A0E6_9PEZI|nr:heterokaryon incompatibility protein-domain-containing protein [Colletotrichum phormii]KAK1654096.1 heterokaryon incompatibility protein-domain-containing protein [Colletotrichum phormii]
MDSQSLVVVAGISRYAESGKSSRPLTQVHETVFSYLYCIVHHLSIEKLSTEPPLTSYFKYEPFDLDRAHFRLVILHKGSKHDEIRCSLFQACLPDRQSQKTEASIQDVEIFLPYEALSYCWGDDARLRNKITVDEKALFITDNLLDALRNVRRTEVDRILWADAICIDQSNVLERGHQVGWMGEVYKHANEVLCWLGHVEHTTSPILALLEKFKREVPQKAWKGWSVDDHGWRGVWERVHVDPTRHDYHSQLKDLMANAWFSRVWILQEVANARRTSIGCSEGWIDGKAFAMAPSLLNVDPGTQCQAVIDIMPGPTRSSSWWAQKPNICSLLWRFRESQATDPRDRLYALLGLASDLKGKIRRLKADYTISEEAVARDVLSYLYGSDMSIGTINRPRIAGIQARILNYSAAALEKVVFSGVDVKAVDDYVRRENSMVWLTEDIVQILTKDYSGGKVMELLIREQANMVVTERLVKFIARNFGSDCLRLLLDRRYREVVITEKIIEAAAGNRKSGAQIIELLLDGRTIIDVTESFLVALFSNFNSNCLKLLLDRRGGEVNITDKVVEAAARNRESGAQIIELLLDRRGGEVNITDKVVEDATRNRESGAQIIELLLDRRGGEVNITDKIVEDATRNRESGAQIIELLLDRRGGEVNITDKVVEDATRNRESGAQIIELLLDRRGREVNITNRVVIAAAENWESGAQIIELLLDRRGGEVNITDKVVEAAARNRESGAQIIELLLDRRGGEVNITDKIVEDATRNRESSAQIINLLLDRRGGNVNITDKIVEAATRNRESGAQFIKLLRDRRGREVNITNRVVIPAAEDWESCARIIEMLLNQRGRVSEPSPIGAS